MQFFKTIVPQFTQLELFSRGLKSMKVNVNIFPVQHSLPIWTSLNHSDQFWRLEWGTDSHLRDLESNLKMFFMKNGMKFF
jgi:hypothetical protein